MPDSPPKIILHPAAAEDLDEILVIESSWPTTPHWSRSQFEQELLSEHAHLFVAADGGMVIGYAGFWAVPPEAQIMTIAVDPGHARRGLGRRLLRKVLDEARSAGLTRATLDVGEKNPAARRLYESEGFCVVGRRPKYYNDGTDALLMDKDLR